MIRTYSVKFKNKSKMLTTKEAVAEIEQEIVEETGAKSAVIKEDGQIVSIEADEDEFPIVMNKVVNVFKKIDDRSEVSYKFGMNR